jgi:hypothetical protein
MGERLRQYDRDHTLVEQLLWGIEDISARIQAVPVGTILGIWVLRCGCFGLYPRSARPHAKSARRTRRL